MKLGFTELRNSVIDRGLCTACGTCIGVCPRGAVGVEYEDDEPMPVLKGECVPCGICVKVCPGADIPIPELERFCFGRERKEKPEDLGVYLKSKVGWAGEDPTREAGCDGGIVSALLIHALESGLIDCCLLAGFDDERPWRAQPKIATTREEIIACAQSKHVVVMNNALLQTAVERGYQKIGIVGVPCQVHAVRMMQYYGLPKPISNRIKLVIGLFCGSNFFFEATRHILYELCGVEDIADVQKLEYRGGGWPGGLLVQSTSKGRQLVDRHLYAYHIQVTAYQRDRCNMCFDWSADLADIAMGSYWLPSAVPGEEKGRSVMMVRTNLGERLVQTAEEAGAVKTETISPATVIASYGYEIKKHGHVNRLKWRQRFGWPTPNYHRRFSFAPIHKELWLCPEKK